MTLDSLVRIMRHLFFFFKEMKYVVKCNLPSYMHKIIAKKPTLIWNNEVLAFQRVMLSSTALVSQAAC